MVKIVKIKIENFVDPVPSMMSDRRRTRQEEQTGIQNDDGSRRVQSQGENSTPSCSICLGELRCPVDTNCGHSFCAQCILTHWHHDRYPQCCRCPICRRQVTLLLGADRFAREDAQVYSDVMAHNQQMRNSQGGFISRLLDTPILLRHLQRDTLHFGGGHLPVHTKLYFLALALALFVYLVSPIDLLPEIIFGIFGYIDDIVAVFYMLMYATGLYRNHITNLGQEH